MADNTSRSNEQESAQIAEFVKKGTVPLKLVTGTQHTGPLFLAPGAVVVASHGTAIFVCG